MGTEGGDRTGKLARGVRVALLYPEWDRSCAACETYQTDGNGGFVRDRRTELLVLRDKANPTPCHKCEKVPVGMRRNFHPVAELRAHAADLLPHMRQAWDFYRRCRAVGKFPDDPLVTAVAAELHDVYAAIERESRDKLTHGIATLIGIMSARRR